MGHTIVTTGLQTPAETLQVQLWVLVQLLVQLADPTFSLLAWLPMTQH